MNFYLLSLKTRACMNFRVFTLVTCYLLWGGEGWRRCLQGCEVSVGLHACSAVPHAACAGIAVRKVHNIAWTYGNMKRNFVPVDATANST